MNNPPTPPLFESPNILKREIIERQKEKRERRRKPEYKKKAIRSGLTPES